MFIGEIILQYNELKQKLFELEQSLRVLRGSNWIDGVDSDERLPIKLIWEEHCKKTFELSTLLATQVEMVGVPLGMRALTTINPRDYDTSNPKVLKPKIRRGES